MNSRAPGADYDLPDDLEFVVRPVAVVRSPHTYHVGTPRQPRTGGDGRDDARPGAIVVKQGYQNLLKDLDGFSHVWVLAWMHHAKGWNHTVVPPRDTERRGLFATRAPHRPNPIALSVVEILRIDKRVIHIGAHDLHEGTPVLDLKPYVAYADSIADARCGWIDALRAPGPDHRDWDGRPYGRDG